MLLDPPDIDLPALRQARLAHVRSHVAAAGVDLVVLTNPVNIRYATDYRGYGGFQSRIPSQYLLVPVEGPVVLHGAYTDELDTVDRCETAHSITMFDAGTDARVAAQRFTDDIAKLIAELGLGAGATVGIERTTPTGMGALADAPWQIVDAEPIVELARSRKLDGELPAMRHAINVAETALAAMRAALEPGVSENELWAILHQINVANDGDWVDGRMLCSGPRTNPWYQEAGPRRVEAGELVALDTDMVGPFGYCADISRTWVCPPDGATTTTPTPVQADLHARALEEISHNKELLRPGASFAELSQAAFQQPDRFIANRYACVFHGVGMSDEYPKIPYRQDWEWTGYDGELEAGTVLSVESYVGADGESEGVKIEQMVQVTAEGPIPLSTFPTDL